MRLIHDFPANYKYCIKWLKEQYPDYQITYDMHFDFETAEYVIKEIDIADGMIKVTLNASFFVENSKELHLLINFIEAQGLSEHSRSSAIWTRWFDIYNTLLYPELSALNPIYRNGDLHFCHEDYNDDVLVTIANELQRANAAFTLYTNLSYQHRKDKCHYLYPKAYLGSVKLVDKTPDQCYITGKLVIYIDHDLDDRGIKKLKHKLYGQLSIIAKRLSFQFANLRCIFDAGPLQTYLGQKLGSTYLLGGRKYETIFK